MTVLIYSFLSRSNLLIFVRKTHPHRLISTQIIIFLCVCVFHFFLYWRGCQTFLIILQVLFCSIYTMLFEARRRKETEDEQKKKEIEDQLKSTAAHWKAAEEVGFEAVAPAHLEGSPGDAGEAPAPAEGAEAYVSIPTPKGKPLVLILKSVCDAEELSIFEIEGDENKEEDAKSTSSTSTASSMDCVVVGDVEKLPVYDMENQELMPTKNV